MDPEYVHKLTLTLKLKRESPQLKIFDTEKRTKTYKNTLFTNINQKHLS